LKTTRIPTRIVPSVVPDEITARRARGDFEALLDAGLALRPPGEAKRRPRMLLERGYAPRSRFSLFDTTFYLSGVRQNPDIRFFVAYVMQGRSAWPRIFYKDISLIWRSASHFVRSEDENWVGKGAVRPVTMDGEQMVASAEETTDLPFEIQSALEELSRRQKRVPRDDVALALVLRRGPNDRIEPYRDFSGPRERAASNPRNLVNGGRPIARFRRAGEPESLVFVKGFEPDFRDGVLETTSSRSQMYGGDLRRFRIVSRNKRVQYLFFAGPRQVWIIPPQATTTELSSFGVRTIDVIADEDLCLPGFEYHFMDDSVEPPELVSQIPEGFVGAVSEHDPARSDASPWIDRLPVVHEFRRRLL